MTSPLPQILVIETNIVLDAFVFSDTMALPVREGLDSGALRWVATQPMRDELQRVLGYPQIVPRLVFYGLGAADVLAQFDHHARLVDVAPKADVTCKDPDDQKFIDLAVVHGALLLSKDAAVLAMARRLQARGAAARRTLALPSTSPA